MVNINLGHGFGKLIDVELLGILNIARNALSENNTIIEQIKREFNIK